MPKALILAPFALTIFLGAFLLFQVQPIIGKYFLPWFGGTSGVWITALVFFQILLLLGYSYAFLLARLRIQIQAIIQIVILVLASTILLFLFTKWSSPIAPGLEWKTKTDALPVLQILILLLISIGFPYFILSSTSTLLQKWFHSLWPKRSPYFLYSLSNTGSLLGLVTYPVFIEPVFNLKMQGNIWSVSFIVYAVLFIICCLISSRSRSGNKVKQFLLDKSKSLPILFLSGLSSLMLVATTSQFTQSLTAVPFIWLIPLSLYLISFILCFNSKFKYRRNFHSYLFLFFSLLIICSQLPPILLPFIVSLVFYSGFLFFGFMMIHGELYDQKPHPSKLNFYYLLIALGSALGGIFAGIFAPLFVSLYWEFFICIIFACLLAIRNLVHFRDSLFYRILIPKFFLSGYQVYFFSSLTLIALFIIMPVFYAKVSAAKTVYASRNFYGALSVLNRTSDKRKVLELVNGKITHGKQYMDKEFKNKPISYYSEKSGIGLAILNYQGKNIRLAVVGLGAGVLSAYGKDGDYIRFYEINPQVVFIAKNYFSYLKDSKAKIDIITDDARLALEKEVLNNEDQKFDLIAVDAFSDEAIPVHLLTKEAFAVYLKRLVNPAGILAIHISNAYIDLFPVVKELAGHFSLDLISVKVKAEFPLTDESHWLLLSRDKEIFNGEVFLNAENKTGISSGKVSLWTDDYSNLIQIIRY